MNTKIAFLLWSALAVCSCSSPSASLEQKQISSWDLGFSVETEKSVHLSLGMSQDQVIAKLGEPNSKNAKPKKEPDIERWTYRRTILGPVARKYANSFSNSPITISQNARFEEITDIDFQGLRIVAVHVLKRPEEFRPGALR